MWFNDNREKKVQYIPVPQNYPMGAYTFAVACRHCMNKNSEKCDKCLCEIESGFELDKETMPNEVR